jgi:hypothetical protein
MNETRLEREVPPNQLAAGGLVVALALTLLFAFSYVGALHDPHAQRTPIGVLGSRASAAVEASKGMYVPRMYPTESAVRTALHRREILAALIPPRLLIVSAGGYAATADAAAAFTHAQPSLRVVDLAPLPAGDSRGLTLFYLVVALIFGGYFGATVVTTLVGPHSRSHRGAALRIGALLALSLLAGFLTAVVVGPVIGAVPGHVAQVGAIGSLVVFAAATATCALQTLLGALGTVVAMVLFVLFGNPSAGLYPGGYVPGFWRAIGPWLPGGAGFSALRGSVYFDGTATSGRLVLLAVYAVAGTAITIALGWRRGVRAAELELATAAAAAA